MHTPYPSVTYNSFPFSFLLPLALSNYGGLFFSFVIDTRKSQQTALTGGAAAVGGLALIAIIALAVLAAKYRLARRFMNRNKVGDLYATQDEQMSRRNAYIQEDDMIEKEDSF